MVYPPTFQPFSISISRQRRSRSSSTFVQASKRLATAHVFCISATGRLWRGRSHTASPVLSRSSHPAAARGAGLTGESAADGEGGASIFGEAERLVADRLPEHASRFRSNA